MRSLVRARHRPAFATLAALSSALLLSGCASPGLPRPPTLGIPQAARDLSATRVGNRVELRFTVSQESTDRLALKHDTVLGSICRMEGPSSCIAFSGAPSFQAYPVHGVAGRANVVSLEDSLDARLSSGPARLLAYRVELFNASRQSSEPSQPAFAVAGAAPVAVSHLQAEGSRQGVRLLWQSVSAAGSADVLLRRELVVSAGRPASPSIETSKRVTKGGGPDEVWLQATSAASHANDRTLDESAQPGETYRYQAQRKQSLRLDGHTLEMRSELSAPVLLALGDTFPPPSPTGLTAAAFGDLGRPAVDLIWEPVDDLAVTGYLLTRTPIDANGEALGAAVVLNASPLPAPAFHDATADGGTRVRYAVVAVDGKGVRSAPAVVVVEPFQAR